MRTNAQMPAIAMDQTSNSLKDRVELERTRIFFAHAENNMMNMMLGALLICAILFEAGARLSVIGIWFALTSLTAFNVIRHARHVAKIGISTDNCHRLMRQKILVDGAVSLCYGIAAFLMPDSAQMPQEMFLFIIFSTLVSLCVLGFGVIPIFCLLVDLVSMAPLTLHYIVRYAENQQLFYFFMLNTALIWQAMLYQKTKQVYRTAIAALTLREQLQDEIEEHKHAKESLQHIAHHDALTGIANRRYFEEVFQRTFSLAQRNKTKFGLLSLDLNDFKPVNDIHGHAVGDALLKAVTERLVETIRTTDFCARIGGDEFSVLIENVSSEVDVLDVTYKLNQALAKPFYLQARILHISASIGSAIYPEDGDTMDELMLVADNKMYRQKNLF